MTALGLAAGVGLVMSIVGVSDGLTAAQNRLLSPLSSVGTDIIVTRTVGATSTAQSGAAPSATPAASVASGSGGGFFGPGGSTNSPVNQLNTADQQALAQSNDAVVTDLSKLGPAGTPFVHDFFLPGTLITFPAQAVTTVSTIPGVATAVGALSLQGLHESGTVPKTYVQYTTGGNNINVSVAPQPLTPAQEQTALICIEQAFKSNPSLLNGSSGPTSLPPAFVQTLLTTCLPPSYLSYLKQVQIPLQTVQQLVSPPNTDTKTQGYSAAGVDASHPDTGAITRSQLATGSWFSSKPDQEVLLNQAYANNKSLKVGGSLSINGTSFTVVGIVKPTLTGDVSDVYFNLPTLQAMATQQSRVNEVLVTATNASEVDGVATAIQKKLPGSQVITAKSLANQVSGSLADAHTLATSLGTAVAILVLLASFVIAVLLTLSSITKRVREIGSLRAMGWGRGLVVRQIMAETLGMSVLGAALGVAIGAGICALIGSLGPKLAATTSGVSVGASSVGSIFNQSAQSSVAQSVQLTAPLNLSIILLGICAALLGGLIAGGVGGWRAARLAPASALRDIG